MSSAPPEGARPADSPEAARSAPAGALGELVERLSHAHDQHQRLLAELGTSERRFRNLARRVWQVQEDERRRVARELHDGLGQVLTALKNELERLRGSAAPVAPERLAAAAEIAAEALASTRELSRLLRPSILDDLGLEPALRWLARTLGESSGFEVALRLPGEEARLPADIETLLFRAAQESLNNSLKHSGAPGATLELTRDRRSVALVVADRGRGCDPATALGAGESGQSLGLRSLRDRVELYGGKISLVSNPGAGFVIELELPLEEWDPEKTR